MLFRLYLTIAMVFMAFTGSFGQINFDSSSPFKYLKGKDATTLPANWMTSQYTPTGWSDGYMPFRFGDGTGGTLLNDMLNSYTTVYMRSTFNVQNLVSLRDVVLLANFDDGFTIWINGEEVLSFNAPVVKTFNSVARDLGEFGAFHTYKIPAHDLPLKEGENLIAIQGFNITSASSDFYFDLQINSVVPIPQTTDTVKVVYSQPKGFYTNPFNLKLDVPDPSYTLIYTIDGSNPQTSSTAINGGTSSTITVDPSIETGRPKTPCFIVRASLKQGNLAPSFPLTQTYIFLDQVMNQTYPGGNWPVAGSVFGQVIDLDMDPEITNSPIYSSQMKEALTSIPTISVVTELEDLFGETGIYVNAEAHGEDWERFSSVELIDPNGNPGFNINAGLRIRGGYSRNNWFPKHAFRLFFRQEYGASKLQYPLFEGEGVSEFDKIDLRCEQNYSWAHPSDDQNRNTAVREIFSRDTQRDMGWPYTRSRYYHLYLNGMYWGMYQTQERSEARYAADYLGGSKEDYDVIKVANGIGGVEATDGKIDSWYKLYDLSTKGFANNADYYALEGKDQNGLPLKGGEVLVNIDNLIDYMQLIFYTGNFDAPVSAFMDNSGPNNFYAIDRRDDRSSGFMFFAHDSEHSLMITSEGPGAGIQENRVTLPRMSISHISKFHPQWLHYKLTSNVEYKQRFADRAYKNFFNGGVFTPQASRARMEPRVAQIQKAIIGESARWGDTFSGTPFTYENWNNEINDIYNRFFPVRTNIVIDQLKAAGLLSSINPPVITKDNVQLSAETYPVSGNYKVTFSSPAGQIFYTLDGSDPRMIGGDLNRSANQIATGGVVDLNGTAYVNARVKNGTQWSALASVKLMDTNENFAKLKVTELHYHPTDSIIDTLIIAGQSFEFIEFKNTGDKPISLAGLKFASSIVYDFKENDILAPEQFYVIASKPKWFYERHFMVPSGNFGKNFANSGEQVIVTNSAGTPVFDFTYLDYDPWPIEADGDGSSLSATVRFPSGNPNDAIYWLASSVYDGTPFADEPGIIDSIDDPIPTDNVLSLLPNPTKGNLYLKVNDISSEVDVQIFTLTGSLIYRSSVSGNSIINLNNLQVEPGIYLVRTKYNNKNEVHKVVYQP